MFLFYATFLEIKSLLVHEPVSWCTTHKLNTVTFVCHYFSQYLMYMKKKTICLICSLLQWLLVHFKVPDDDSKPLPASFWHNFKHSNSLYYISSLVPCHIHQHFMIKYWNNNICLTTQVKGCLPKNIHWF